MPLGQSSNTAITDKGGRLLLEAMKCNTTVTSISLVSLCPPILQTCECHPATQHGTSVHQSILEDFRVQEQLNVAAKRISSHDCEEIDLSGSSFCDDGVKEVLDALIQGKFTRVKTINLVSCAVGARVVLCT